MGVLEKQKHMKPYMSQAMSKLSDILSKAYANYANAMDLPIHREGSMGDNTSHLTAGDSISEERM